MTQTAINREKLAYQEQNSVCPPARDPLRITECWLSKYTRQEGTSAPLVCYVSELDKSVPLDAERLLRLLGVSGKLSGFHFAVYMLEQVQEKPEYVLLITKRLYSQTAQYFHTTTNCVERNLRTLVQACWRQPDHSLLERIAGHPLSQPPTNAQFIDMVAAFLRK